MTAPGQTGAIRRAWWPWRPNRGGVADPRGRGESADPFGINDPAGRPKPRGPLMSPGFWLHHAALAWRQKALQRIAAKARAAS